MDCRTASVSLQFFRVSDPPRNRVYPLLTDRPLTFEFDPDTGIVWMTIEAGFGGPEPDSPTVYKTMRIGLTLETSRSLLAALPNLQSLLEQASKGPTKPRSVQ